MNFFLAVSRVVRECGGFGTLAHEPSHIPKENGVDWITHVFKHIIGWITLVAARHDLTSA
jgi:hypothetical protein